MRSCCCAPVPPACAHMPRSTNGACQCPPSPVTNSHTPAGTGPNHSRDDLAHAVLLGLSRLQRLLLLCSQGTQLVSVLDAVLSSCMQCAPLLPASPTCSIRDTSAAHPTGPLGAPPPLLPPPRAQLLPLLLPLPWSGRRKRQQSPASPPRSANDVGSVCNGEHQAGAGNSAP